jgi:hypothetical protein
MKRAPWYKVNGFHAGCETIVKPIGVKFSGSSLEVVWKLSETAYEAVEFPSIPVGSGYSK